MPRKDTDLASDPTLLGNDQPRHGKHAAVPANVERMTKSGRQRVPGAGDVDEPADEELTPVDPDAVEEEEKDGNKL